MRCVAFVTCIGSYFNEATLFKSFYCCYDDLLQTRVQEWNMLLGVERLESNVKLLNQLLLLKYHVLSAKLFNRKKNNEIRVNQRQH